MKDLRKEFVKAMEEGVKFTDKVGIKMDEVNEFNMILSFILGYLGEDGMITVKELEYLKQICRKRCE